MASEVLTQDMHAATEDSAQHPSSLALEATYAFPATFAQQRLWFLDQLYPEDLSYLIPWSIRMKGSLSVPCLTLALNEIVCRHETLRTTFSLVDNQVMQVVAGSLDVPVEVTCLETSSNAEEEARSVALDESRHPMSLATGPLIRAQILRLSEREHILLLTLHHIVFDQWSRGILIKELSALYGAALAGASAGLPGLKLQYADFAVWQRRHLQGEVLQERLSFWSRQLAGTQPEITLPADRPRPAKPTFGGALMPFRFSAALSLKVREFSGSNGVTLFMTLLTAFQALLARYSGQDDVVVGTPVSNRSTVDLENLIGFFTNTLALRLDLSGDPSFAELVARTRKATVDAYKYQDLPFERLVQEINPERSLSHNPLFQAVFSMANVPVQTFRLPGLECEWVGRSEVAAKFDLSVFMRQSAAGLQGVFEYSTDLFDEATVERMAGHYKVLLEAAVSSPETPLSRLPLLTEGERHQLLVEWNNPSKEFARGACVHELFEQQAARTPLGDAVVFEGRRLTYAELNRRANQLAHHLRSLGVGPETLVAICMERSLEMVVAILGVLKSGGGYLPLDPVYPADRLAFMLDDAQVPVLLTQSSLLPQLPVHEGTRICLDENWFTTNGGPVDNPVSVAKPENVAYVIYTSGSTGKPKGVLVTHANVARLFTSTDEWFRFGPKDTWTLFHSFAFDFSVWEIWGALLYGGRLVVVPLLVAKSPQQFHELLVSEQVTVLNQTPSAFRQLIAADELSPQSSKLALRYVVFGGEALEFKSLLPWIGRHGDKPELINMYGITETTVHVTYFKIVNSSVTEDSVSLVGVPIPDLQVYVLDSHRQPVPVGVNGEMYVGGHGVARGYLNRPELSAERFVEDVFHPGEGRFLYKSGDLARYRADGNLQYLGRIDHQVKIRGFRVELGEIEAVLAQHQSVRDCLVMAREDVRGDQRLVAYVVPKDTPPAVSDFRKALLVQLPEYMVPASFIFLDEFPLTPNGKVNRKALPAPGRESVQDREYVAPRNAIEEKLVSIWSEVLRLPQIGIDDDFFEIGGHSLLAVELFGRIEREMGDKLPLSVLFKSPTVAQVAAHMGDSKWTASETSIKPCRTGGSKPPIYACHGIGGTVLTFRAMAKYLDPDRPIYCLEELGLDRGWKTLEDLAMLYAADIRKFQPAGPYHLIGSSFGGMVAFEIGRQLELQDQKVGLVGLLDSANLGATNLRTRSQRIRNRCEGILRRIRLHLGRLRDRKVSEWPRFLAGRVLAIGRRFHGVLWRVAYRSYSSVPATRRISHSINLKRVFELAGMDYLPKPLRGRLVLFRRQEEISSLQRARQHGWSGLSGEALEIIEVPGTHNSMMAEPHVAVLAKRISEWLDRYESVDAKGTASSARAGTGQPTSI